MKKLIITAVSVLAFAGLAMAQETVWEDDFSGYTGELGWQGPWRAQSPAFTNVPNNDATGSNEVLVAGFTYRRMLLEEPINLTPGDSVQITLDHRYVTTNASNYGVGELVIKDTNADWTDGWRTNEGWAAASPSVGMYIDYNNYADGTFKYWPDKDNKPDNSTALLASTPTYFGFQPNAGDGTSDVVRIIYTITKSLTENEFEVDAVFSNLTSGATLSKSTVPNIVNENAWNDGEVFLMFKSANPQAKDSDVYFDRVKVEILPKPQFRTALFDDFSNPDYQVHSIYSWQVADIWNEGLNNNDAFSVNSNEVAVSQFAWRGIASSGYAVRSYTGETVRVSFDFTIDLGTSTGTYKLGDYCLVPDDGNIFTNGYNNPGIQYDQYGTNGMSARLEWNAWKGPSGTEYPDGRLVVHQAGSAAMYFDDPSVIGLSPILGADTVSDNLQVTFAYEKSGTLGEWFTYATVYNVDADATFTSSTSTVMNANAYTNDLFMAIWQEGNFPTGGGYTLDNMKVEIESSREPPAPVGFDAFVELHGLSGDPDADKDNDSLSDWGEYVFDGIPTDDSDLGTQPVFDGSDYVFSVLGDDALTAYVLTNVNLVVGEWGTNAIVDITSTNGALSAYTNSIGQSADNVFIKLEVVAD